MLYAVQSVYAEDSAKALEQVVFFYVPFALLFALLRGLAWRPRTLACGPAARSSLLALVFTAIGFWEFQTRHLLLNPKVIASNQVEEYFRVNSLFFDPNIYGRFLALVMIGLASVLIWAKRPRSLALTIAALVVLWGGLITTLSQSSFAALLLGLLVLAWLRFGGKVVRLAGAGRGRDRRRDRARRSARSLKIDINDADSLNSATSGRFDLMEGGIDLAREKPLLGWGSGSFNAEYRSHERSSGREATAASHTIPITVAAEQGIIGLAAYVALLALAFVRLLRGARGSPVRAAIAAGFFALVLHTWLYAAFLEDPVTWTLLALGTALALPAVVPDRGRRGRGGGAQRPSPRAGRRGETGALGWDAASRGRSSSGPRRSRSPSPCSSGRSRAPIRTTTPTTTWSGGAQLLDGLAPTFTAYAAPTQHPLYVALGAVLGCVFGESADRVLVLVCLLSHALLVLGTYRLGAEVFGRWSGRAGGAVRGRERVVPAVRGARVRRRPVPRAGRVGGRARRVGPRAVGAAGARGPAAARGVGADRPGLALARSCADARRRGCAASRCAATARRHPR